MAQLIFKMITMQKNCIKYKANKFNKNILRFLYLLEFILDLVYAVSVMYQNILK